MNQTDLPNTFCPAKWDEVYLNLINNYAYACCKSVPLRYVKNYNEQLNLQKINLLNNIQDPSCEVCWKLENNNLPSLRTDFLKDFDITKFEDYQNNNMGPKLVEVNLGNECNFQCVYCNPKFSSKWEKDVKDKPYKLFTDKHFYNLLEEVDKPIALNAENIEIIKSFKDIHKLSINGGEPLQNKLIWDLLDRLSLLPEKPSIINITTNLSNKKIDTLDKLISYCEYFDRISINVSLDATDTRAEFIRYGLDFKLFEKNLIYLLENKPSNFVITIISVMSSLSIQDLSNLTSFVQRLKIKYPELGWRLNLCEKPEIQSFSTLTDKDTTLQNVKKLHDLGYVKGVDVVESAVINSKFKKGLYIQLKFFLEEFSNRKNLKIPFTLE